MWTLVCWWTAPRDKVLYSDFFFIYCEGPPPLWTYFARLLRVTKQNSKLVLVHKCQTKEYRWIFPPVYGTSNESLFLCFFSFLFGWVSGLMGAWVTYCLHPQQQDSRRVGSIPLFSVFVLFFALFSVLFFGWVREFNFCCCSYSSILHSVPKFILVSVFGFPSYQTWTYGVLFFWPLL